MWQTAPLPVWWRDTFRITQWPTDAEIAAVLTAGDSGVRAMFAVIDPAYGERPVPQSGPTAREFAVAALGLFRREDLIEPLFAYIDRPACDESLFQPLAGAIAACGPAAAHGAVSRFLRTEPGDPMRAWWAEIAANCGARDDGCLAVVVTYLREQPIHGAFLAKVLRDERAVPALLAVFDDVAASLANADCDDADPQTLVCVGDALRSHGHDLGPERAAACAAAVAQSAAADLARRRRQIQFAGFNPDTAPLPPPRDPCPCASGREYGACCAALEAELNERFVARCRGPQLYM